MSFIRFVIPQNDEDSGRRQGLFTAIYTLDDSCGLSRAEQEYWREIECWFDKHLKKPKSFTRSAKPYAKHVALSWFKDSAIEHIRKVREVVEILREHGMSVEMLQTERPGYIVYEDQFQVAAEPFNETTT